ncbi:hypothetical protein [Ruegeria atlantica]|uniref:hypothetical protein n=1 Tax=Ruegeria atlantica TaxID=81569 RepID=UPI00147EE432
MKYSFACGLRTPHLTGQLVEYEAQIHRVARHFRHAGLDGEALTAPRRVGLWRAAPRAVRAARQEWFHEK